MTVTNNNFITSDASEMDPSTISQLDSNYDESRSMLNGSRKRKFSYS